MNYNDVTAYVLQGDCLETLRKFPDACIDSVVSDPPYGLSKQPPALEMLRHWLAGETYEHSGRGFMGKTWDSFVPGPEVWREVLRVLKPGGHALVFSGTRTYDLTVLAMRIAGFEIRDQLAWMYGTGFPKSTDYAADHVASKAAGHRVVHPEFVGHPCCDGWGTALKPAQEPICLARKPLTGTIAATVLEHGTGALNIDGCRIGMSDEDAAKIDNMGGFGNADYDAAPGVSLQGSVDGSLASVQSRAHNAGRWPANVLLDEHAAAALDEQTGELKAGTAVRRNGVSGGATSISRPKPVGTPDSGYGGSGGASRFFYCAKASKSEREAGLSGDCHTCEGHGAISPNPILEGRTEQCSDCRGTGRAFIGQSAGELTGGRKEGSAGLKNPRAGAGRTSRGRANTHPTVKPIALMRYLVRLVTPPGGIVLDPYAGSGSTGCAAVQEGARFVGCELSPEYVVIAQVRIAFWGETEQ